MSEFSQTRLETKILEAVGSLIVSGQIKNHNLSSLVSLTRIDLSPDNSQARIYVSYLADNSTLEKSVKALNQASAFIQARLSRLLRTKKTPVLTFVKDTSYIEGDELNRFIDSLNIEKTDE